MQYGDALKALQKAQDRGVKVPALENRPELTADLVPVFQCWSLLHGRRQVGFTANPLSFADIQGGLDYYFIEGELREDWTEMLIALDSEFLIDQRKKTPRKPTAKK